MCVCVWVRGGGGLVYYTMWSSVRSQSLSRQHHIFLPTQTWPWNFFSPLHSLATVFILSNQWRIPEKSHLTLEFYYQTHIRKQNHLCSHISGPGNPSGVEVATSRRRTLATLEEKNWRFGLFIVVEPAMVSSRHILYSGSKLCQGCPHSERVRFQVCTDGEQWR